MSILVDKDTKLIVQGITGTEGLSHARAMRDYGTRVLGGVSPEKPGERINGFPVYRSVTEAKAETGANTSAIFVPPAGAADAIHEALEAGIELIVCVTEGIPVADMIRIRRVLPDYPASRLIGPNCPGVISPGKAKVGIMPGAIHAQGCVGIVSRSGTLMYEAVAQLGALGLGESTCVGIGGDFLVGIDYREVLALFEGDDETNGVLLIGEVGGMSEIEAAEYVRSTMTKPVAAFVAGKSAPRGRRMGHAGAIAEDSASSAASKMEALLSRGLTVIEDPACMGQVLSWMLQNSPILL
jgi:succinyl-CoA synthetase, alpha subunit